LVRRPGVGAVVVVVAEVLGEVALERCELRDEGAREGWAPALFEDRELEPLDVAVRGWSAGADPALLDPELLEAVAELA
jgi:hypothetical protein